MTKRELLNRLAAEGRVGHGVINGFRGSWMSGLGQLVIDGIAIPCDNAPTVRALEAAFGGVIAPGHTVSQEAIQGKEVYYSMDDMGLVLESFTPVDSPELEEDVGEEILEAILGEQGISAKWE